MLWSETKPNEKIFEAKQSENLLYWCRFGQKRKIRSKKKRTKNLFFAWACETDLVSFCFALKRHFFPNRRTLLITEPIVWTILKMCALWKGQSSETQISCLTHMDRPEYGPLLILHFFRDLHNFITNMPFFMRFRRNLFLKRIYFSENFIYSRIYCRIFFF